MRKKPRPIPLKRPEDIMEYVRAELQAHSRKLRFLAALSGFSLHWLRAVMRGNIKDPSYIKVATLLPYLGIDTRYVSCKHFTEVRLPRKLLREMVRNERRR